jgi:hypothetical protein
MAAKAHKRRNVNDPKDSFEETAKRLECDEDKARFEEKLGKIAKAKPETKGGK